MKRCMTTALRMVQGRMISAVVAMSSPGAAMAGGARRSAGAAPFAGRAAGVLQTAASNGTTIRIAFSCVRVARPVSTPAPAIQA